MELDPGFMKAHSLFTQSLKRDAIERVCKELELSRLKPGNQPAKPAE
jgi:hypothetical protein